MLVLLLEDLALFRRAFGRPLLHTAVAASAVWNLEGPHLLWGLWAAGRCVPLPPRLCGSRVGVRHAVLYLSFRFA